MFFINIINIAHITSVRCVKLTKIADFFVYDIVDELLHNLFPDYMCKSVKSTF